MGNIISIINALPPNLQSRFYNSNTTFIDKNQQIYEKHRTEDIQNKQWKKDYNLRARTNPSGFTIQMRHLAKEFVSLVPNCSVR